MCQGVTRYLHKQSGTIKTFRAGGGKFTGSMKTSFYKYAPKKGGGGEGGRID